MTEFLIYNKDHWMDALDQKQLDEYCMKHSNFMQKYNARYQRGDIVEIHEDGFWTGANAKGFDKSAFRMLSVPGMSLKDAQQYHVPYTKIEFDLDTDGNIQYDENMEVRTKTVMLNRCKFSIFSGDSKDVEVVAIKDLQIIDKDTL